MNEAFDGSTFGKRPPKVFLCYSHVDGETVHALYSRLKKDGLEVWLDKETLSPGQDWEYEIRMGILKSDVVIACLSNQFNKETGYRHEELKIALEKAKLLPADEIFIIPVRLEECEMPESLRRLQRVDIYEDGGYRKLKRALRKRIAKT